MILYYYTFTVLCFTGGKKKGLISALRLKEKVYLKRLSVPTLRVPTVTEEYVAIYGKENIASFGFILISYIVMFY